MSFKRNLFFGIFFYIASYGLLIIFFYQFISMIDFIYLIISCLSLILFSLADFLNEMKLRESSTIRDGHFPLVFFISLQAFLSIYMSADAILFLIKLILLLFSISIGILEIFQYLRSK